MSEWEAARIADKARKAEEKVEFRKRIDSLKLRMQGRWMCCIAYLCNDLYEAVVYCQTGIGVGGGSQMYH